MSAEFHVLPLKQLLRMVLEELDTRNSVFGIPVELFFVPDKHNHLRTGLFEHALHNPLGVAAGPHTQLAGNIIGSWLMGARYIELKTIQTLDELDVPKPCIDMQDEGYNCEWSQELKIDESFNEYLNAWIIIHILNHRLGGPKDIGTIFNMSVGYNLQGILNENVQWFLNKMHDSSEELNQKVSEISHFCPEVNNIEIPACISDNITLSTMHGCPAGEIEDIARYLIEQKNLHTFVKLNPTLLGAEELRDILNNRLGFRTLVPDMAFEHDLKYRDAIKMIRRLDKCAEERGLQFGLKLTNTLESVNNRKVFGSDVEMMYMSGRALHPISVNLARKLQNEFSGELMLSFSAGANAFNISELIACGFKTVTVCSDILKPGGYMRLNQYFEVLATRFSSVKATSIDSFVSASADNKNSTEAALSNLNRYADAVADSKIYRREYIKAPDIKTSRTLGSFDCISAPCRDTCATSQDIPDYLYFASEGRFDKAFEVILRTNPFPSVTGMVCDHLCQGKCTRINYDDPLQIREVKRFISEQDEVKLKAAPSCSKKAAVIGAGPSGLSCAYYLRLAGFTVDVFESRPGAGGMVQFAIPGFRLTDVAITRDIKRILDLGVTINYNSKVDKNAFESLKKEYDYVFIGSGAQLSAPLDIEGSEAGGVIEPLRFLFNARQGLATGAGNKIVIIGGGNTAMDAARTAFRLTGENGSVTIVYRRTVNEMPADQGEIKAVLEEGVEIIELAAPEKIIHHNGKVKAIVCSRMELKGVDKKGRPAPVKKEGSEFGIECDTVIPAIGQLTEIDFVPAGENLPDKDSYITKERNVFIGGDALRGASTAINAIGDGRKAAAQIIREAGINLNITVPEGRQQQSKKILTLKRAKRLFAPPVKELPADDRKNFSLVNGTHDRETVIQEASRCLNCDELCNICTTVCPNFANVSYEIVPCSIRLKKAVRSSDDTIDIVDDGVFEVRQKYQILNIADFCNECGNCNTFCPTAGAPFKEKPHIHLTITSFNTAKEGYYLAKVRDRKNLILKQDDHFTTLSETSEEYVYENDYVLARFSKENFVLDDAVFKTPCIREAHFKKAAEMFFIMRGADSLVFG